ncbi:serine/threonine-protein kinase, partial [bacterium]|nr:serine/threonine-protein kinase [bacterium]
AGHPRIENYRILEKIGEGGMGEVFLAEQERPIRRRVAIKLIKEGMDSKQVVARFESERQALAIMDHPAIARVYEGGIAPGGRPYFVMEWVPGEAITEFCDRHRLDLRARLALFIQVCDGVQHAHRKAILHRDLKPSNILVASRDDRPAPKIIDFGVAKATAHPLTEHTLFTAMGQLVGTPSYMSPEQTEFAGNDIDTRTDVYSLGVLLYELLVGMRPLDLHRRKGLGFDEVLRTIREQDPEKPSSVAAGAREDAETAAHNRRTEPARLRAKLRGDLDWITLRALEKDRHRRYGSPAELADDIERHLKGEAVLAGSPGARYRLGKFVHRHLFGVAAGVSFVLLLMAFAVMMAVQAGQIARERDRANLEAAAAQRVSDFLVRLFEISDPMEGEGDRVTARQLLDEGAARIEAERADQPVVRARFMRTMGRAYRGLGLFEPAGVLLEGSLRIVESADAPDDEELADALLQTADIDRLRGEFDRGLERAERALAIRQAETPPDPLRIGQALGAVGRLHMHRGEYETARDHLERALAMQESVRGPDDPELVSVISNMAIILWQLRDLEAAEPYAERALALDEKAKGPDHPDVASALNNLALIYLETDRERARDLYERSLSIRERALAPDHPDIAETCNNLGNLLRRMEDDDRARELLERGLSIREKAIGPDHPDLGSTVFNIGLLLDESGKPDEARPYLERALRILEGGLGADHPHVAYPLNQLGNVAMATGDRRAARRYYGRALALREAKLEPDSPLVAEVLDNLAKLERAEGNEREAAALNARADSIRGQ